MSRAPSGSSGPHLFPLAIGTTFLLLNSWWFGQAYLLKHSAVTSPATVSRVYTVRHKGSLSYNVDYAFEIAGRRFEGSGDISREMYLTLRPGGPVEIRYVPANPSISEAAETNHSNTTMFLALLLGFPISIFILIQAFRGQREEPGKSVEPIIDEEFDQPVGIELPNTVQGIAFTMYPVTDMKRARKFYEEELGLKAARDFRGEWVEYHLWDNCFALTTMGGDAVKPSAETGGSVAFEVTDVDDFVHRLRTKDIQIKVEPFSTPVCRMAVVIDPEGNALTLHHKTKKTV